ncbi:MAG: caspase family protein, partial [Limnohabitans sp.]
ILVLDQSPSTPDMRTHLNDWVKRNKGQLVDEVFWYFTGHGIYYGDARFCGRDYSPQLLEATSLSNQEVDDLLRLLQPRVVVKVIDACQSGAPYIKGHPPAFRRALEHSRLESFISMCSCTREQSSYAHLFGSDFTLTWLEAVLQRRSGVVSYRQIEQHLIQQFQHQVAQTPFFVKQGTGHEMFCRINPHMQTLARTIQAARLGKRVMINRSERPKPSQPRSTWPDRTSGWPRTQPAG